MAFKIAILQNTSYVLSLIDGNLSMQLYSQSPGQLWEMIPFATSNNPDFPPGVVFYNASANQAVAFGGNNQLLQVRGFTPPKPGNSAPVVDASILWTLQYVHDDSGYYIRILQPEETFGQIWESRGDTVRQGNEVETWNDNGGSNQKWQLIPV